MADIPQNTEYKAPGLSLFGGVSAAAKAARASATSLVPGLPSMSDMSSLIKDLSMPKVGAANENKYNPLRYPTPGDAPAVYTIDPKTGFPVRDIPESNIFEEPQYLMYDESGKRLPTSSQPYTIDKNGAKIFQNPKYGGELVEKQESPGTLLKSVRKENSDSIKESNKFLTGGIGSRFFQIDHIIPLQFGGADTAENRQALSIPLHEKKTKIEAVAKALYRNGDINLNQARDMAFNWREKDEYGTPAPDENGNVPLEIAKKKAAEWASGIPRQGDNLLKQFGKGLVSGATLGWIEPETNLAKDYDKSVAQQVARGAGAIVGGLASTIALASGIGAVAGVLGKAIWGAAKAPAWFNALSKGKVALKLAGDAGKVAEGAAVAEGVVAKNLGQKLTSRMGKFLKGDVSKVAAEDRFNVSRQTGFNVLKDAGLFGVIGQLHKPEDDAKFSDRVGQFIKDASLGAVTGAAGKNLQGVGKVAAGTYAISILTGDDVPEALMNSALMAGFHGVGSIGAKKRSEIRVNKMADDFSRAMFKDSGVELPVKPTEVEISEGLAKAAENINLRVEWSPEDKATELKRLVVAGRQLFKGGLAHEARTKADMEDVASIYSQAKKLTKEQIDAMPPQFSVFGEPLKYVKENAESIAPSLNAPTWEGYNPAKPTGEVWGTGFGGGVAPHNKASIERYVAEGGKAGDRVVVVLREDPGFTNAMGSEGYSTPKNVAVIYGEVNGKMEQLGVIPTAERIAAPKDGIKQRYQGLSAQFPDFAARTNPNFEITNDSIANGMRQNGLKTLTAKIHHITPMSAEAKQPFVSIDIAPEDWALGKVIQSRAAENMTRSATEAKAPGIPYNYESLPEEGGGKGIFNAAIRPIVEAVKSGDAQKVKGGFAEIGVNINEKTANKMAGGTTIKEIIKTIKEAPGTETLQQAAFPWYESLPNKAGVDKMKVEPTSKSAADLTGWAEVPRGAIQKPGGTSKMDMATGENYVKVPEIPKIKETVESNRVVNPPPDFLAVDNFPKMTESAPAKAEVVKEALAKPLPTQAKKVTSVIPPAPRAKEVTLTKKSGALEKPKTLTWSDEMNKEHKRLTQEAERLMEDIQLPSAGKPGFTPIAYTSKLMGAITNLEPNKRFSFEERQAIRESVAHDLLPKVRDNLDMKFSPENEASFGGGKATEESIKAVSEKRDELIQKRFDQIFGKAEFAPKEPQEKLPTVFKAGTEKRATDEQIKAGVSRLLSGAPKKSEFFPTTYAEKFRADLEKGAASKSPEASFLNETVLKFMDAFLGKNWDKPENKWASLLSSMLSNSTKKGKNFTAMVTKTVNEYGHPEAQPEDFILKNFEKYIQKKPVKSGKESAFPRKSVWDEQAMGKRPANEAVEKENKTVEAELLAGPLKQGDRLSDIQDLTTWEKYMPGFLGREKGLKSLLGIRESVNDGEQLVRHFIAEPLQMLTEKKLPIDERAFAKVRQELHAKVNQAEAEAKKKLAEKREAVTSKVKKYTESAKKRGAASVERTDRGTLKFE